MHQLEFTNTSTGLTHTDEGRASRDDENRLVFETEHENRPNYRISGDSVTLLSANTDAEVEDFGSRPQISGYCIMHDLDYDRLSGYDHCPQCRMERDREAAIAERMARRPPRSVDDPAPVGSYDAF